MSSDDHFGLSENELKVAICALKVMLDDGQANGQIEKNRLANLTGHDNAASALRVWNMAKKLLQNSSPSRSATSMVDVDNPTKGPKQTAAKMRTKTTKKRGKKQTDDEEAGSEVDEKPAKKRVKKEVLHDAGIDMQGEI